MTTMFTTMLETISDIILLISIIYTVNIIYENNDDLLIKNKNRIIISIVISCAFSIIFNQNFFDQLTFFRWLFVFVNFFKYILLTAYTYKRISSKSIFISLIIQFICATIASSLLSLIQITKIKEIYFLNIVLNLFVRVVIIVIILYIKNNHENIQMITIAIPTHIYVLILLSLFLSSGLIQTVNFATSNITGQIHVVKMLALSITICTSIIILSLLFNVISKKYQRDINITLEKQIATQLYHYEQLEKMNIEIRRFKHDFINHIKCMESILENEEYDDLSKYFHKISGSFPNTSFMFETGNYIADAILTEKQVNSPDNISIEFDGVVPKNIGNTDLCIILSNALDNAVEACCLCDGHKIINVYSGLKHGYFVLKITNPTVNKNADGKMTTTKSDKINHGFGLSNIKRTVKKYSGHVSTSCEDNIFTINITFSNNSYN